MLDPLETIEWRLQRADEHLAAVDRERHAFLNQEDRGIVGEFNRETSEYIFRFAGKLPEPRIGLIVGEFAHQLRSALDNVLWQLVLLRGGTPTRATQFPIYESRQRYASQRRALRGVSADDRALIESVQPFKYRGQERNAYLALLAWLNNVDKHRVAHVGCAFPGGPRIPVTYRHAKSHGSALLPWLPYAVRDVGEITDMRYSPFAGSNDRAELARCTITDPGDDPKVEMEADGPIEIALSDPHRALILTDLELIRENVVGIVEGLRPRFAIGRR